MNTHADKLLENKSQSVANVVSQKQNGGESTFQFLDNRPEAIAQRKLQEMANNYTERQQQPIPNKENKTGLPDNLKTGIENLSGYSMDDIKVHTNSDKPAQLNAHAFAQGIDIHLGPGQEKHLPHEAWHVVQQKQGRVRPTMQMKGNVNVNDDAAGLEKGADKMGAKAVQMSNAATLTNKSIQNQDLSGSFSNVNQLAIDADELLNIRAALASGRPNTKVVDNRNNTIHTVVSISKVGNNVILDNNGVQQVVTLENLRTHFDFQGQMESVDQNRELFVQSNNAGEFRYTLPADMTYHHIIPRNILASFWNRVQANSHIVHLSTAIDKLIEKAIERVHRTEDLEQNSTILEVNGVEQSKEQLMDVMSKIGLGTDLNAAESGGREIIEKIYQWWPANIHHGPTDRPTNVVPEEDDGGDHFEKSAEHVVKKNQFNMLSKMNDLMDQYKGTSKNDIKILKNIKGLIIRLSSVTTVTKFNKNKWYQIPSGTLKGQWRIRST